MIAVAYRCILKNRVLYAMNKSDKNLLIIAIIAIVNALGYGIIIPILYTYSHKFGLSDFQNGLLFALFSVCQFVSTPIIGRLSDRYGRKPLLLASVTGTAVSFFLMAGAPSAFFLFVARALDGITAGNIPVLSAIISDTMEPKDRAKGFGIIGASFGFGFIFGPAISALTVGIADWLPFVISGVMAIIAVVITAIILPETNKHTGEVSHHKLFDFKKLAMALVDPNLGTLLLITVVYFLSFSMFTYVFQPFSVKVLGMGSREISMMFTLFGVFGLLSQLFLVQSVLKKFSLKKTYPMAMTMVAVAFLLMGLSYTLPLFVAASILLSISNAMVNPLTQAIIANETDAQSQGVIMGLQTSYMSIGQILGPIIGGGLGEVNIHYPFLGAFLAMIVCFYLSFRVFHKERLVGV